MTIPVDPFVIPIPAKWARDPDLGPTVQYLWKFLYDLWQRTGGGNDAISDIEDSALYDVGIKGAEIAEINKQLEELKLQIAFQDGTEIPLISALSPQEVYMQDDAPASTGKPFIWVETGLPGGGISLWADDGT